MSAESSSTSVYDNLYSSSAINVEETTKSEISEGNDDKIGDDSSEKEDDNKLKREVGLFSAIMLIVGSIIGSGIFISPTGVLKHSGSVAASLIVWTLCGVIALMGALCYAELGTAIPVSGAEYSYFLHAYGSKGRFGPIPAFLYLWMCSLIIKTTTVAVQLLTFAEYIVEPIFPTCAAPAAIKKLIAFITICFITFINCYSVKISTLINNAFTIAKLLAIAIVVITGVYMLSVGNYQHLSTGFEGTTRSFSEMARSFYFGLWAYDSWNNLNFITEELINPHKNLPRSILIGIPLVTVCYVLSIISYLTVLSPDELLSSDAVAVGFANKVLGPAALIIPILVAASVYGASNGTCLVVSRLPFVAAREGHWAEVMSYVQVNRLTPTPALIFNAFIVSVMIYAGDIGKLIELFSFVAWMFYGGMMVTVIVMRFTEKDLPRPYKVPFVLPVVMTVISAYLVFAPIIENPQWDHLYSIIFLLSALIFYIPFVHFRIRLQIMEKITHLIQLLLICAPSERPPS